MDTYTIKLFFQGQKKSFVCGVYESRMIPRIGEHIALALESGSGEPSEETSEPHEPVFLRVVDLIYQAFNIFMTCDSVVFVYDQKGEESADLQVMVEPADDAARRYLAELEEWHAHDYDAPREEAI